MISCAESSNNESQQIIQYYDGFKFSDYNKVKEVISDSLTIVEGENIMRFTPDDFHTHFKWDSVFKPAYKLIEIEQKENQLIATVSVNSLRFEFLKNNPLTCKFGFYFKSGKISKIENLECIDADWNIWQKEVNALVDWVNINHPELNGFIHDLTMEGALNYLKAIELYESSKLKTND